MSASRSTETFVTKKQELSSLPLIRPYRKEGIALHAEETVQTLLDNPQDTPDIIKHSDEVIADHFNSSITVNTKKLVGV